MRAPEPMYATIGAGMPSARGWTFEQKYDGMRVVALVSAKNVGLVTRNGRDKSAQFPELVEALRDLGRRARRPLVLDGEIVALARGKPAPFQALQSRMQLKDAQLIREKSAENAVALVLFDILQDGRTDLMHRPWRERR